MIKGLSETRRLPRLGKIHLGIKKISKKTGNEYPDASEFFVCPDEVKNVYGEEPKELDIMFPTNDVEMIFPHFYKRYGSGTGIACRGDGEQAFVKKTGEYIKCPCEYLEKKVCKAVGNLFVILFKVDCSGVYQIDTGSINSIINLNSSFDYVKSMFRGKLSMLPLRLKLEPKEVNPEGIKKTVYVMSIYPPPLSYNELIAYYEKALDAPKALIAIEAPKDCEIEEDLYPEEIVVSNGGYDPVNVVEEEVVEAEVVEAPKQEVKQEEAKPAKPEVPWKIYWGTTKAVGMTNPEGHSFWRDITKKTKADDVTVAMMQVVLDKLDEKGVLEKYRAYKKSQEKEQPEEPSEEDELSLMFENEIANSAP